MGALARTQIAELTARDEGDELWFASVLASITDGESLDLAYARICKDYAVSWGALRNFIKANPEKEKLYQDALEARLELRRERAAANVAKIAAVEHEEKKVSVPDTLKAAGMVLNISSEEGGNKGPAFPAEITIRFVDAKDGRPVTVDQV